MDKVASISHDMSVNRIMFIKPIMSHNILILFVGIKGQISLYLHVTTVESLVMLTQIVSRLGLKNLGTKLLSLEKMNQVLKNKLIC
jgi:DUF1009 family protein